MMSKIFSLRRAYVRLASLIGRRIPETSAMKFYAKREKLQGDRVKRANEPKEQRGKKIQEISLTKKTLAKDFIDVAHVVVPLSLSE